MGGHTGGRSDAGPNKTVDYRNGKAINQKGKTPTRKDLNKSGGIVDFIAGGGVTGMVVRAVAGQIEKNKAKAKDRKINDTYLGSPDYQGDVSRKPRRTVDPRTGNDNDNNNSQVTQKSIEQPKVKSQMSNTDVKSGLIIADKIAPTKVEMTAEEKLVARKRGKKTKTVLTDITGLKGQPTLSEKTLLG
tara:strand:+ start:105 stop:668 length:564 start_codon:yes stop_codon:yes gene_type:complete